MKNLVLFLLFIIYATVIFVIPNNMLLLCPLAINLALLVIIIKKNNNFSYVIKKAVKNLLKFMPFILLTFVFNCILDAYINAIWMVLKLALVCNITFIYSQTTTTAEIARTVKNICAPLKLFKVNTEQIEVLVAISLAMIPVLKKEYREIKEACKVKNIKFNVGNIKIILSKLLTSFLKRVADIDDALVEKGFNY